MAEVVRSARVRAESIGWASPALRAHEGRTSRSMLDSAAASLSTSLAAPGARVAFYPGGAIALDTAVRRLGRLDLPAVTSAADREVILTAVGARNVNGSSVGSGHHVAPLPVDALGRVRLEELARVLTDERVGLVVLAVGNPEVGTLQPLTQAHEMCRDASVPLLVDATMAAGRLPLPPDWDAIVVDARSWAGGEGIAALVIRPGISWTTTDDVDVPALPMSAPPVPGCAAAALGLELAVAGAAERAAADHALIARARHQLAEIPDVALHGDPAVRLPHVLGLSILYVDAEAMLLELDRRGIAVASGSACATRSGEPSHVLAAMGELTSGNLRVTLPLGTQRDDIDALLEQLPSVVADLRAEVGL